MTDTLQQSLAFLAALLFTNIDEFVMLVVFMSQGKSGAAKATNGTADRHWLRKVIWGTMLGFTIIVGLSLLGLVLGQFVPDEWLGIGGFLPILFGMWNLYKQIKESCCDSDEPEEGTQPAPSPHAAPDSPVSKTDNKVASGHAHGKASTPKSRVSTRLSKRLSHLPARLSKRLSRQLALFQLPLSGNQEIRTAGELPLSNVEAATASTAATNVGDVVISVAPKADVPNETGCWASFEGWVRKHETLFGILSIAIATIANSGDNVAVYLPLIASSSAFQVVIFVVMAYVILILLMGLAYLLTGCDCIAEGLEKYGAWILPFPLILIGLYILSGSVVFHP